MFYKVLLVFLVSLATSYSATAQTPTLNFVPENEVFIGEQTCFEVSFVNTGTPGYGPYVRLILPADFNFDGATFAGSGQTVQNLGVITSSAPNNFVIDPTATSNANSTTNDTIFAPVGSTVLLLEYPVGSLVDGGVALISEVCVTVTAGATVGTPQDVCVQGMYEFGDTPTGDNGSIAATAVCQPITPILYRFEKRIGGSDGLYEGVPGGGGAGCHIHEYQLNVDIAAAGTLSGPIIITDALPGQLVYFGNISTPTGCAVTQQPTVGTAGGTVEVTCNGSFSGSTAAIDMQVTFDAAVADTLDETICDQDSFFNNASAVVAGNPTQRDTVQTNIDHLDLSHANNAVGAVSIGQTVQYTIGAKITEYTAGLTSASITFVVADGMVYNPASLTWAGAPVLAGNTTIVAGPGTGSTVTVDIHTQNGANILPCAGPALQYTADVNQTYANGDPVLSRDVLTHTSTITYDLAEGAAGCTDDAGTSINLNDIFIQKTVNNSPPTGAGRNGQWWPGDVVQYRLELRVPSLDLDDVIITDFFPLPIHDVTDLATTFGTDVRFDASTCSSTPPINYTINAAANSLELEFGDLSNSITGGCVDIVLLIDIPITTIPFADGLFHSNFMQVNSDNTAADDETKTVLTLIQVAAPDLDLTKGIVSSTNPNVVISPVVSPPDGNATQVNGGDSLFYQITIENEGAAPGYDLNITDVAPPELTNCTLVGATPVVDGNNNAIPFTGGFSGNSLNIDVATADSIAFAGAGANNFFINISYVCEVVPNIGAATILDNTAQVDWSSARGSVAFPPISDAARAVAASPTMNKIVDYIMPNHSGNNSQALIGEVIAYEVQLYIPEGNLDNLTLTDRVEEGLAFVGVDSIVLCTSTGATNIATSVAGGFASVQSGATISNIGAAPQQQDRELVLDFGNIQNLDTDNVNDTIKVFYQTIVINHSTNSNGQQLRNIATARWDNPNTPGNQLSINDRAPFVTVIEPALEVTKSFMPEDVLPNNTSFVTITVSNPATISSAPAYNVNLQDVLPTGMLFVAGSGITQGGTAMISDSARFSGNTLTAGFDTINVGETYSVTFEVGISSAITPCFTLTNCANITWESIAQAAQATQPMAFSSNLGVKRSGNPTALGGTANDYSRDSCADLNVVIDNTFDPFITGNTPICEGERAVLQVQQYNGNRVTYNWTGPGVPAGFNNFELILDPVSAADVGTYYVIVELDGCITDTSNFFQLNLRPQPNTPIISPDTTVCEGSQVQFTTSTIANSYTWTGPNGFSANSATTPLIRPITFSDAGVYSLFTTNSQGCNSPTVSLTLGVNPRPNTPTLANNSPICSGENIMLSTNASADSYMWIAPNGQDTVTTTGTLTIIPNSSLYMAGNWALSVADANGCISQPSTVSNVIINRTPVNPITSNSGPICEGDDVTLNVNTIGGATYSWYSDAALSNLVATSQNPVISGLIAANLPDSFYVQINSNGCLSSVGVTGVLINSNPANFAPNYNAPICAGDSLALFANTTAATYSWAGPSGFVSNLANPIIANANANNAGSYALSIQDANNCSSTGVVQVAINTQPTTPTITSNAPLCEGNDLTLEVAAYTGNSVTYNWTTPTGTITTNVPMLTIANAAVADSGIYAIIVDLDGCSTLPDSTNIVIHAAPVAPNVPANFTVCEGQDTIVLTTNTIANRYTWTGPNGFSSTSPNPAAITPVSATNAGTYSLVVENFNGCTSVPANTIVTVNPRPNRPALSTNSAICQGEDLVLTTNAIATSYTWTAPNGASMTTTVDNLIVLANSGLYQSGDWTVAITDANGCTSMASIASNVVINSVPNSASPTNNGAICNGSAAQLSAGTIAGASYAWYTDAAATNQFSTLQNPMVNNLTNDSTFYLIVTVNGCATPIDSTTVSVLAMTAAPNIIADSAVCEGQSIALLTTTTAASYNWSGPNGFNSTQQNPAAINSATIANTGRYTFTIIDANGCMSAVADTFIRVNPRPNRPALSTNSAICQGEDLVLTTNSVATSYTWTAPNGASMTTTTDTLIVAANSGMYQAGNWTVAITDVNGCISMASIASNVVINGVPNSASPTNNGAICSGAAAQLSAGTIAGTSYAWYTDAAATNQFSTLQNPMVNNLTNDSTFYLIVTVNGCATPIDSTTVSVFAMAAAPNIIADSAVCEGQSIALLTTTTAASYNWSGPNGFNSTQQNPSAINSATVANTGRYTFTIIDANGCMSAVADTFIRVNPRPNRPALSTNSAICQGEDLVLTTNAIATSYTWTAPNGASMTTTSDTLIVVANSGLYQAGSWTVAITDANGCISMASIASNVVINSVPNSASPTNNGAICNGSAAQLSAGTIAGASYAWYTDAAATNQFSTLQNPMVSNLTNDSTFYLIVTVNGCATPIDSTIVSVLAVPTTPIIIADSAVCEGQNITLTTSRNATGYTWTGPNGFASSQQNPAVIVNATTADAGTYTLFVTDANGCTSADTTAVVVVNTAPAAAVLTNNSAICTGDTLVLNTTATADTFRWITPNGLDTFTTSNSLVIVPTNTAYYQAGDWALTTQVGNNCPSMLSSNSTVVINSATAAPTATNNGPVCTGAMVTLSTPAAPNASYEWYSDAALTNLIATTATTTVNNITTDSTFYVVVIVSGCTSPAATTTVQVIPQPAAPIIAADSAVCAGDNITLTTTTIANSYVWTGPNGFSATQQNPAVITNATTANAGVYSLQVVYSNGCQSADTMATVIVNQNPAQPVLSTNSAICAGDNLVLTTNVMTASYTWIAPNGVDTATTTNSLTINSTSGFYQSGNWTLVTTNTAGCSSVASAASNVVINAVPTAPLVNNNGPVCNGATGSFTTAFQNGATYEWYSDAALTNVVSVMQNPTLSNITNDTTWYLVVTQNGCSSAATASTIRVLPVPNAPNIPADFDVCQGDNITLSTTTRAASYNWTGPNGFTSNLQNPSVVQNATAADAGVYTLFITDINGCQSSDTSVIVLVNPNPAQPVLSTNSAICMGEDLVLTTNAMAASYIWTAPNGIDTTTTSNSLIINVLSDYYQPGNWTVVAVSTAGCQSVASTPRNVIINLVPVAALVNNNGPVCNGASGQFSATIQSGAIPEWYSDASLMNLVSTIPNPTLNTITSDTTWHLVVTENGCPSAATRGTIQVLPAPNAPNMPADFAVCGGDNITLSTTTRAASYNWTGPNGFTSNLQNPTVVQNATAADAGIYTLSTTTINGCQSSDTSVTVTVNANPPAPTIVSNSPLCFGDTLVLRSSTDCGQAQWIGPNGNSASTLGTVGNGNVLFTRGSLTRIPSTNANYLNGAWYMLCIDTTTGCATESNTINVTINPIPVVSAFNNGAICSGENGELSATPISGATYEWYSDSNLTTLVSTVRTPTIMAMMASATYYVVATVNGCTSLADSTRIEVIPAPVVPQPSYTPLCQLDTLFLFANATGNMATYRWTGPSGFVSTLENPVIPNIYPFNAGSYGLTVADSFGCDAFATVEVTIYPKPATPTISHNAPFCEGTMDLTLTTQAYFGTNVAYYWTLPNGTMDTTTIPSLIVSNATQSDTGLYRLMVFVDGCVSLAGEEEIRIYPTPATPAIPADFAVCVGDDIVLTTTTNAANYFWTGPNGFQSNLPSPTVVSASAIDTGVYTLYVTNTQGCRSTDTSVYVGVNANPAMPTIVSNTPICFGDTLVLSSSSSCDQSQWIGPNGNSASTLGTAGGGNVLFTNGSTTRIPATNSNYLNGAWYMICIDTTTGCRTESNTINVEITPVPATPAVFNNSPICIGEDVQLTTTTVTGASYNWYADSTQQVLVATSQNPIIRNITSDTAFYLFVTVNGCTSAAGVNTVLVNPIPATPSVAADFAICAGDALVLNTTTVAASYNWTGPNGFVSNLQNPTVVQNATLVDSGSYVLSIVDNNGCESADTMVQVTVNPNPTQAVLTSNSSICEGDNIVLSTTAAAANYRWTAPNGADTTTTIANLVIDATSNFYQDGDWTVVVIDSNGCESSISNIENVVINGIPTNQAIFNSGPVCVAEAANLFTSFVNGASYEWYADSNQTTLVATAQNPTVRNIRTDSTFYLYLTVNGCRALVGTTTVNVHAIPTAPTVADSITVCQGDALVLATTTRAAGYNWTGPNGFQSNLQNPSVVSMAGVVDSGTYNLYIIDSNGCQSLDATTTVVVDPIPVTPFITSNNTPICAGDDLILTASNAVAGATYEWFSASSNLSVGIGQTLTITAATTTNAGDYYVVTTLNNCNSEPSAVTTAIIDAIPTTQAFAGTDIGLCNQFGTNLNAAVPNSATGIWTTNSGATIANANSPNTAVYNLPIGSSTFYWTLSNGACLDFSSDSMIVDVTPSSSDVANAGLDQRLCGVDSATLVATAPTTSTGMWTQSAAQAGQGVVIANPTNATTTVNGLQGGTNYNFVWTLSNGNCVDYSSDIVNIDIAAAPIDVAYAGTPILVCDQTTINLAAQASQYGTGMWTTTSSATIIDPTSATTTVVNLAQDSSYFVWSLSNGICMDYSVDSVLVVSSSSTDIAEAGNNQVICNSNTNLTATAPSAGTGRWSQTNSQAAQGVTIVNPTDPATQVIGMTANTTYVFTWVLSNGTCVDYSSDNVAITVNAIPPDNAFAGNDINLCGVTTTSQLNASVPVAAMGLWTTSSTATISNPTRPSTTVSGLSIGQNIFVWTLSSGSCVDYDTDTIVITVTAPSNDVADAGLDSAYCNQTTVQLNAAAPTVGGGYWSQTASQASLGATITTPTDTATTVNGLIAGVTYTFTWTLTNGGCVDYSNDQVLITIDALPTNVAYAGEDTILCGGNRLQLEATMPPIGTGFWTTNDSATIVTPSAFNTQVVNIQEDTTVYYWTLSNGACVDYSVDSMEVIISPASRDIAFAGFDQTLCGVDSILLQADTLTSSTGRWTQTSAQSSQGIVINNPTQPNATVTGIQVGQSYNFTWTISTLGCPNFSTDEVTYNINALPPEVAYAGTDIILCAANSTNLDATNPQFSTGRWLSNSTSLIINPTLPNTNVVNIPTDTVAFYWALSNGACIDYSIDTMLVIVTPTTSVDTANAGLDIAVCNADTAQLMALTPTVATGRWTQPNNQASAGVVITNVNDPNSTVTGLQLDSTYSFSWSVSNGPCVDYDTDAVQVQVSSLPSDAAYAGLDVVICNEDEITLIATTPSVGTGFWTTTSSATIVTPPRTTTEIVNLPFGVNQFIWTLSNGACRNYSTDTVLVEIDDAPVANADSFVVIYNSAGNTIDVTPNDDLNTNWIITVTEGINKGILTNLGTGEFDIVLTDILVDQQFIYQLCNPNCPVRYCDTARVVIDVQGGFECNIPNMMTPNGDDINENFVIPCLDGLEGTKLQVYNRWGDLMYESDNYKNTWNATHNEMPVPDATYFYIMELEDGRKYQGFVEVRR